MTLSSWVNPTGTIQDGIIVNRFGANGSRGWALRLNAADYGVNKPFECAISSDGTDGGVVKRLSVINPASGTFYHAACVYNASAQTFDIYVNGILDNGTLTGTVPASQFNPAVSVK